MFQMLSLSVLDAVLSLDVQGEWLKFLTRQGYLQNLCANLQWEDDSLKKMLHPVPEALRALYIYESKMVRLPSFTLSLLSLFLSLPLHPFLSPPSLLIPPYSLSLSLSLSLSPTSSLSPSCFLTFFHSLSPSLPPSF